MDKADILIAGGGTAGLAAAAAFGALGLSVIGVDPGPSDASDGGQTDLRTTAILAPGRALLEAAGVWSGLDDEATALRVMRIVDASGARPVTRDFDSADLGDTPFGWNVPNRTLKQALAARVAAMPNVDWRPSVGFSARLAGVDGVVVTLSDGARVQARLLVGADGRDSAVRRACGIGVRTTRTGQKALVFAVAHEVPHDGVSTEVHRQGGPFTLVPLPDLDGQPRSAVVWMTDGPEALRLCALSDDAFAAAINDRSAGVMGLLRPLGPRQVWPIVTQVTRAMVARRTALMAEAAHVLPPIGAQGLNTSLADVAALLSLMRSRPQSIGEDGWLRDYAQARERDVMLRATGIAALNLASMAGAPPLTALRSLGLRALHDVAPLRRAMMRLGLGGQTAGN